MAAVVDGKARRGAENPMSVSLATACALMCAPTGTRHLDPARHKPPANFYKNPTQALAILYRGRYIIYMEQEKITTDTSVRCRRLDATTGDQCTHRAPWQTGDCGAHAPKATKSARKQTTRTASRRTTRRPAPARRTRFHDDIDAADMGWIN